MIYFILKIRVGQISSQQNTKKQKQTKLLNFVINNAWNMILWHLAYYAGRMNAYGFFFD